eukprot:3143735-Prymnesium_polylepis.1
MAASVLSPQRTRQRRVDERHLRECGAVHLEPADEARAPQHLKRRVHETRVAVVEPCEWRSRWLQQRRHPLAHGEHDAPESTHDKFT